MSNDYYINEVLDIRYITRNREFKHKQITFNKKIVSHKFDNNNIQSLKENLESDLLVIYENKKYSNQYYYDKYDHIIQRYIDQDSTLLYVIKYHFVESNNI